MQALPFDDDSFDVVVCQFGVMFFPDRPAAFAEVRRVLRPGGRFLFDVWTQLAESELAATVVASVAELFPDDPPRFVERTPHGYHDPAQIAADLRAGGFTATPTIEAVEARSRAASAHEVAVGYCRGTPMYNEIVARDPDLRADGDRAGDRCAHHPVRRHRSRRGHQRPRRDGQRFVNSRRS